MGPARFPLDGRAAAINVDVDSLYLYYRLHDVDEATATNAIWERGVPRFAELFAELGVRATFFVVASDLERWPAARRVAQDLVAAGHELGNHTWSHPYALTHMAPADIASEIARAHALLSDLRGRPVAGFRAPGYHMNRAVYEAVAAQGYSYSSSLFPCPPYYLAKVAYMAGLRLRGKRSQAIMGDPRIMVSPTRPHHRHGVRELPITVLPYVRMPFIGTSLLAFGDRGYHLALPLLRRAPFVNFELHGIDLCDLEEDGIDPALSAQPDLRVSLAEKRRLISRAVLDLKDGWGVDTLEELAPQLAP